MKVGDKLIVKHRVSGIYRINFVQISLLRPHEVGSIVTVSGFLNEDGTIGDENANGITLEEDGNVLHPITDRPLGHSKEQFELANPENV